MTQVNNFNYKWKKQQFEQFFFYMFDDNSYCSCARIVGTVSKKKHQSWAERKMAVDLKSTLSAFPDSGTVGGYLLQAWASGTQRNQSPF